MSQLSWLAHLGWFWAFVVVVIAVVVMLVDRGRQIQRDYDNLKALPHPELHITTADGSEFERTQHDAPLPHRLPSRIRDLKFQPEWRASTKLCRIDNFGDGPARNPRVTVDAVSPSPESSPSARTQLQWDGDGTIIPPHDHAYVILTQTYSARGNLGFVAEPSDGWTIETRPDGAVVRRDGAVEVSLSAWCEGQSGLPAKAMIRIVGIGTMDFPSVTQVSPAVPRPG